MRSSELFGTIRTEKALARVLDKLIDGWCERRCLEPLGWVLPVWPLYPCSSLTECLGELLRALRTIETLPTGSVTDEERERVGDCRRYLEHVIDGRLRG